MRWHAWYTGGREYDSETSAWRDLPPVGVLGVLADGRLLHSGDWYWIGPEGAEMVPTHHQWGQWAPRPDVDPALLKQGEAARVLEWDEVLARMRAMSG